MTASTADSSLSLKIEGGGSVNLQLPYDGSITTLTLTDVAYAPGAHCNLVSMSGLALKAGVSGTWDKDGVTLRTKNGYDFGRAVFQDGLYFMDINPSTPVGEKDVDCPPQAKPHVALNYQDEVWKWHRRFGHLGWAQFGSFKSAVRRSQRYKLAGHLSKSGGAWQEAPAWWIENEIFSVRRMEISCILTKSCVGRLG